MLMTTTALSVALIIFGIIALVALIITAAIIFMNAWDWDFKDAFDDKDIYYFQGDLFLHQKNELEEKERKQQEEICKKCPFRIVM